MKLRVTHLPIGADALREKIEQKHINKEEYMFSDTLFAINIDVICCKCPYLNDGKRAKYVRKKKSAFHKSVFNIVQEQIISADDVNKD